MLLIKFLELGVVAARGHNLASRQHAVSCRHPAAATLPRTCHGLERSLSERHIRGMAGERHGNGMACVNKTWLHCVNQMGKTQSKALAERQGNGTVCVNWPLVTLLHFSHDRSNCSSPSFCRTTFRNFSAVSELLPEAPKYYCQITI
jgi:hypothetical protein